MGMSALPSLAGWFVPILRVNDAARSARWYADVLGLAGSTHVPIAHRTGPAHPPDG